ncbi:MAG: hypothetical protein ACKVOW_20240 [Chitinophagaceae bacterium]
MPGNSIDYRIHKDFFNFIIPELKKQQGGALVVLGAYIRGTASRWFKECMADIFIKESKLPSFIAHNKKMLPSNNYRSHPADTKKDDSSPKRLTIHPIRIERSYSINFTTDQKNYPSFKAFGCIAEQFARTSFYDKNKT